MTRIAPAISRPARARSNPGPDVPRSHGEGLPPDRRSARRAERRSADGQHGSLDPRSLAPLGLTGRQGEVLAWVAEGKTNEEIGLILGTRPATVAKHLERIYRKLGVATRTAAAVQALSMAGALPPAPG
jgi:DNA-binding CsgD family transcriptional regulator